jgi:hypothetical protein
MLWSVILYDPHPIKPRITTAKLNLQTVQRDFASTNNIVVINMTTSVGTTDDPDLNLFSPWLVITIT